MDLTASAHLHSHQVANNLPSLPNVKNILAIASGKGGVGKSATSVNLGLTLTKMGLNIGILDADIYGPSIPTMLGLAATAKISAENKFIPLISHNMQVISIACLMQTNQPVIWRGPMASGAVEQLFKQTLWQPLDYLIVDLPPGTGDIQLTLVQKIPLTAAIIVTTPQEVACIDAQKALTMFHKLNIPVLGIIENMAEYVCTKCGNKEHIFGSQGGAKLATTNNIELLGSIPLAVNIDLNNPKSLELPIFKDIANKVNINLAKLPRNTAILTNKVVVS